MYLFERAVATHGTPEKALRRGMVQLFSDQSNDRSAVERHLFSVDSIVAFRSRSAVLDGSSSCFRCLSVSLFVYLMEMTRAIECQIRLESQREREREGFQQLVDDSDAIRYFFLINVNQ